MIVHILKTQFFFTNNNYIMPVTTIVFYAPSKGSLGFKACLKHKLLIISLKELNQNRFSINRYTFWNSLNIQVLVRVVVIVVVQKNCAITAYIILTLDVEIQKYGKNT